MYMSPYPNSCLVIPTPRSLPESFSKFIDDSPRCHIVTLLFLPIAAVVGIVPVDFPLLAPRLLSSPSPQSNARIIIPDQPIRLFPISLSLKFPKRHEDIFFQSIQRLTLENSLPTLLIIPVFLSLPPAFPLPPRTLDPERLHLRQILIDREQVVIDLYAASELALSATAEEGELAMNITVFLVNGDACEALHGQNPGPVDRTVEDAAGARGASDLHGSFAELDRVEVKGGAMEEDF